MLAVNNFSYSNDDLSSVIESCVAIINDENAHGTLIFVVKEKPGSLAEILRIFKDQNINLSHIESRPSKTYYGCHEILIECNENTNEQKIKEVFEIFSKRSPNNDVTKVRQQWFPRKISDLDLFEYDNGDKLDCDHPGFRDEKYKARRQYFADLAQQYKHGQRIPKMEYTEEETQTWRTIYNNLIGLFPTHACKEFNAIFPLMQEKCGYGPDKIPQLQEVSDFLKGRTGFTIRPAAGLLSSRDFLAGLAFRVFHSTQYIRHSSVPQYTPEPDICHELLGHAPLFADPDFAKLSQEIGLQSLGAPDDIIKKLATFYWFTIEFGVCLQNGERKAYGAGLLSSYGELQYALSNKPETMAFDAKEIMDSTYPITEYQPKLFLANSFADAKKLLIEWATTIERPYHMRYNPYTECIELIDSLPSIQLTLKDIKDEIIKVEGALAKLNP